MVLVVDIYVYDTAQSTRLNVQTRIIIIVNDLFIRRERWIYNNYTLLSAGQYFHYLHGGDSKKQ